MKRKSLLFAALVAAISSAAVSANTIPQSQITAIQKSVAETPVLELVPTAAKLVQQASVKEKEPVALAAVRAVLAKKVTLATAVVEAISKVAPSTTLAVATLAAELCPEQADTIAQVASLEAPIQAKELAVGLARIAPKKALRIAQFSAAANPDFTPEIAEAVGIAVPEAKAAIDANSTLKVVSAFARSTRSSGSTQPRSFVGSRPNPNRPTTPPAAASQVKAEARSTAVVNALKELQKIETDAKLQKGDQATVSLSTVVTLTQITRNVPKQNQEAIINAAVSIVKSVIAEPTLASTDVAQAVSVSVGAIAVIVSDTELSPAVQQSFAEFTATKVAEIVADNRLQGKAVGAVVSEAAGEVTKVVAAVSTITPEQATARLQEVATKIETKKNEYAAP